MTTPYTQIACATVISLFIAFGGESAPAEIFVFDFETGFDGWQQQWHEDMPPGGSDGVVTHSTERGFNDGASLKFDMGDGVGDDGTLWIEKQFAVSPTLPTHIAVTFQLFNENQGDVNTFEVKTAIGVKNPEQQADFTTIGVTDTALGWVPFEFGQTIAPSLDPAWVALGIRVSYEGHRDYWIDHVVVSTNVVPEPSNIALVISAFAGIALLLSGRPK